MTLHRDIVRLTGKVARASLAVEPQAPKGSHLGDPSQGAQSVLEASPRGLCRPHAELELCGLPMLGRLPQLS
jgi:hypothetical protein